MINRIQHYYNAPDLSQQPVDLNLVHQTAMVDSVTTPTTTLTTRTSLGSFLQEVQQQAYSNSNQKVAERLAKRRPSLTAAQLNIIPGVSLYGHTIKAGFQKIFCRNIDELYDRGKLNIESPIEDVGDVDFVFIVKKPSSRSFSFRCANWFARTFNRDQVTENDLEMARLRYLEGLKTLYKISYAKLSTEDYDFYPVKLSFYHLGLMMQLLGYSWRLRTAVEEKYAFKTFYFMKRDVERYHEYHQCKTREDFSARWRYDLAYNFLTTANVPFFNVNPWRCLLKPRLSQHNLSSGNLAEEELERTNASGEKSYSLLHLFTDEVFDDWLVPHTPIHEQSDDRMATVIEDIQESGTSSQRCCANCCFPCWTCQCQEAKENRLSSKFEDEDNSCGACGTEFCNGWRAFCFHNSIDCTDACQRPNENEREFLGRISTVRNAFTRHSFPSPHIEEAAKIRHILPLRTLVDYLGEKIGFYFGWIELLILSMTIPSLLGSIMFIIGVGYYGWDILWGEDKDEEHNDPVTWVLAKACDNYATPAFAAIMVIWGTTFYEIWHRREKWYSHFWHVEKLETTELEKPVVYSFKTTARLKRSRFFKPVLYFPSFAVTIFFIGLVFLSVYFVNVVGVFAIPYCPKPLGSGRKNVTTTTNSTSTTQSSLLTQSVLSTTTLQTNQTNSSNYTTLITKLYSYQTNATTTTAKIRIQAEEHVDKFICSLFSAAQVIANSLSMIVLDFFYTRICYVLTDIEGHKTQSAYTNALVLKLFTFRFFNYYSVLFYIAFGIAAKAVEYPADLTGGKAYDYSAYGCGEQPCMALLSRQLLSVIVTQPLINSLFDVTMPCLKYIALSIKRRATSDVPTPQVTGKTNAAVEKDDYGSSSAVHNIETLGSNIRYSPLADELEKQANLTQLSTLDRREFTTEEYTEKVIVYGALLMFSVALPPAPALAILIMRIDLNLDIGRIMNDFRRPIPLRSQDIGMWGPIVNFLTYLGIVTNPLIVILTSSWGNMMPLMYKFLIFLGFEHIVFAIRMLVSFAVPDVPKSLVREELIHKATKDELQSLLLDAKIEQAEARSHIKQQVQNSVYRHSLDNGASPAKQPFNRLEAVAEYNTMQESRT